MAETSQTCTARTGTTGLNTREKASPLRVLTYAGAILALLIGSGFATGQEILQYFASYGFWGIFGTGLLVLALMAYVCVEFFRAGQTQQFERPTMVYRHFCGKYVGGFFDWFSILFVFLSFTVMVSGAGAVFEEHYGLSKYAGGIGLAVVVGLTVWFGLGRLVDIIGKIGPVIVVIAVGLGVYGIAQNPGGIVEGNALVAELDVTHATPHWALNALSYVGFCMLWLAAFLAALGKSAKSRREVIAGGAAGGGLFSLACMVVGLGLLASIAQVHDAQIPMLVLAGGLGPFVAGLISVMILAGIYTTAVPLLWTVSSRFFPDRTRPFKLLTVALAAAGTLVGLVLPFADMVKLVYSINGYVGIALLVIMIAGRVVRTARGERI
ncbi:YkvI family membrane protein [Brevibacterium album]|uniref:YkvI family membrane protein n=1 Tax=Brevibacterium album TaxID=417948 RepID=UPI000429653B|nr:hypothetical protein [Brevibacterium album]